jgi:alpha-amylase
MQHKFGGDRRETFNAVPVHPENRLHEIGKVREIEVRHRSPEFQFGLHLSSLQGWTAFDFPGRSGQVRLGFLACMYVLFFDQYSQFRWTQQHFTGEKTT